MAEPCLLIGDLGGTNARFALAMKRQNRFEDELSLSCADYPTAEDNYVKPQLEEAVDRMQQVILLGRQKREEVKIGLRTPLARLTIINRDAALLEQMQLLDSYIREELNVREVSYSSDESAYIELVAKPNFPLLGKRLGMIFRA